jgi:hypothetical protein
MADLITTCRVCGCTEMDPCTVFAGDNVLLSEIGPCAWVEPDLCDNCDRLIDAAAAAIVLRCMPAPQPSRGLR